MENISAEHIRKILTLKEYQSAIRLYTDTQVELDVLDSQRIHGQVLDGIWYAVNIEKTNGKYRYECSCNNHHPCRHCGAALFQSMPLFRDKMRETKHSIGNRIKENISPWKVYFSNAASIRQILKISDFAQKWIPILSISFSSSVIKIVPRYGYVRKDGTLGRWRYLKTNENNVRNTVKINAMEQVLSLLNQFGTRDGEGWNINNFAINGYLIDMLRHIPLFEENDGSVFKTRINITSHSDYIIKFKLEKEDKQSRVYLLLEGNGESQILNSNFIVLSEFPIYLYLNSTLYRVSNIDRSILLKPFVETESNWLAIKNEDLAQFWENYFPSIPFREDFIIDKSLFGEERREITRKKLYMTEDNGNLYFNLVFAYGDVEIKYSSRTVQYFNNKTNKIIKIERDWEAEHTAVETLYHNQLEPSRIPGEFKLSRGTEVLEWIYEVLPKISVQGFDILGEEKLTRYRINRNQPTISVSLSSGIDWFDLDIDVRFGEDQVSSKQFINAIADGRKYIKLSSGNNIRIPDSWLVKMQTLAQVAQKDGKKIRINRLHLPLVESSTSLYKKYQFDSGVAEISSQLKNLDNVKPVELPVSFKGVLRSYQKDGFQWLHQLWNLRIGGILADDMGLGKTIQSLVFLASIFEKQDSGPVLIVMPASLIFNWEREIEKFTPSLTKYSLVGSDRLNSPEQLKNYNIILTTYGIIRRDWYWLSKQLFSVIILDESQNVKNPLSQSFKAISKLKGRFRLALSGTPVENTTIDVWTQMAFLNPGLLGSLYWFRRNFAVPIEKEGNVKKSSVLNKLLTPLILRRKKEQVADDLPPKIEQIVFCNMTEEQNEYYKSISDDYKNRLLREIDALGLQKSKIRIIEYLTRIRQVCNHPRMIDKDLEMESGKMLTLMELVRDITAEGYKVLVFSQFVKMLQLVKQELHKEAIEYAYLDGQTRNREAVINKFQNDERYKVFLISIKAGGLGLNLTAAEYVIQIDPWWNPAVENQATDRAHRIGQNKKVFVYKLITHGTVEEKILELQNRKRVVSDRIIDTESGVFKGLSKIELLELFNYDKK